MRGVDERVQWYMAHRPTGGGRCAEYLRTTLDIPFQGFDDATGVARAVQKSGHMHHGEVPKGAILYWDGGSEGHGHVALGYNSHADVASVDVAGEGTVGIRPFPWFEQHWKALRYLGWSWWAGNINTEEDNVAKWPAVGSKKVIEKDSVVLKPGVYTSVGKITLPDGEYILTLQGRLPAGHYARVEFQRVGWGNDPDGRDQTGSTPWTPPDAKATSYSHSHPIGGGGLVDYVIKSTSDSATSVVVKATRIA